MVVLDNGIIICAYNLNGEQFYTKITNFLLHANCTIVIEDIAPYSISLKQQVIDTCKYIGELSYRLINEAGCNVKLIPRSFVKKWAFDTFNHICVELIDKKISKKGFLASDISTKEIIKVYSDGSIFKKRKASYVYIDDNIMTKCMMDLYKIPPHIPGKGYMFGLRKDSWQALAVASAYLYTNHFES